MRILSVVRKHYYGAPTALEPMYVWFTIPLREMGHDVDTFDHFEMNRTLGRERATTTLVEKVQKGGFDLVFYQTSGQEPVETAALAGLSRRVCIAAWNSDDDWQWDTTRHLAGNFTFMITTYPHIYQQNRIQYPNLLLSQWGCLRDGNNDPRKKDIAFSFAGSIYGERNKACRYLSRKAGLACFGRGARLVRLGLPYCPGIFQFPWLAGESLELSAVHDIWKRSRISYTPLAGSARPELQIKARLFEMGLSGTMVLCEYTPLLHRYYEPEQELVTFRGLEDCADKARWYLAHESEQRRVAQLYRKRTLHEHMWEHRFRDLFLQMGMREPNFIRVH